MIQYARQLLFIFSLPFNESVSSQLLQLGRDRGLGIILVFKFATILYRTYFLSRSILNNYQANCYNLQQANMFPYFFYSIFLSFMRQQYYQSCDFYSAKGRSTVRNYFANFRYGHGKIAPLCLQALGMHPALPIRQGAMLRQYIVTIMLALRCQQHFAYFS